MLPLHHLPLPLVVLALVACASNGAPTDPPDPADPGTMDPPPAGDAGASMEPPPPPPVPVPEPGECELGASRSCFEDGHTTGALGTCRPGTQVCVGDPGAGVAWGPCIGAVGPAIETCNTLDDDCDGVTDEAAICTPDPPPDPPPGTCPTGIDLSMGGTFMMSTCGRTNAHDMGCNADATPEVLFHVGRGIGGSYSIDISDGFIVGRFANDVMTDCMDVLFRSPYCHHDHGVGFVTSIGPWWAVEREGGGCGTFTLTVRRVR